MKMDNPIITWDEWERSSASIEDVLAFVNTTIEEELKSRDLYFAIVPSEDGIEICFYNDGEVNFLGKVLRVTFIDVKAGAEEKITELAKEICASEEHNLIIEELTAYVTTPKKP